MSQLTVLPGIGHNSGDKWLERAEIIMDGLSDFTEVTWTNDKNLADLAVTAKMFANDAEEARKVEKEPHAKAAKAVDDAFKPRLSSLEAAKEAVFSRVTSYLEETGKNTLKGNIGTALYFKEHTEAVFTDYDEAFEHYSQTPDFKDDKAVMEVIRKLASKNGGIGVSFVTRKTLV